MIQYTFFKVFAYTYLNTLEHPKSISYYSWIANVILRHFLDRLHGIMFWYNQWLVESRLSSFACFQYIHCPESYVKLSAHDFLDTGDAQFK